MATSQKLTPISDSGGVKAFVAPLGQYKALVIESRRPKGIDKNLKKSGALAYVVDTSIKSGYGPIQVYPTQTTEDPYLINSVRAANESVTIEGLKVEVTSSDDIGDVVKISVSN